MTLDEARRIREEVISLTHDKNNPARELCRFTMRQIDTHGLRSIDHLPFPYETAFHEALRIARAYHRECYQ